MQLIWSVTATMLLMTLLQCNVKSEYIPPGPLYRCPKDRYFLSPCKCDQESDFGITVSCENTNLAKMAVGLNNLAEFKLPVEKLTISRCNIGKQINLFKYFSYKIINCTRR